MKLPDSAVQIRPSMSGRETESAIPTAQQPSIHIDIERLALEGFDLTRSERAQLQAGMTAELQRLVREDGFGQFLEAGALPSLRPGGFSYRPGQKPADLGRQIARAVYKRIGR